MKYLIVIYYYLINNIILFTKLKVLSLIKKLLKKISKIKSVKFN